MKRKKLLKEKMWAVKSSLGFYIGTWLTRKDAKKYHADGKSQYTWERCAENGDEVVRVEIRELWPKGK